MVPCASPTPATPWRCHMGGSRWLGRMPLLDDLNTVLLPRVSPRLLAFGLTLQRNTPTTFLPVRSSGYLCSDGRVTRACLPTTTPLYSAAGGSFCWHYRRVPLSGVRREPGGCRAVSRRNGGGFLMSDDHLAAPGGTLLYLYKYCCQTTPSRTYRNHELFAAARGTHAPPAPRTTTTRILRYTHHTAPARYPHHQRFSVSV